MRTTANSHLITDLPKKGHLSAKSPPIALRKLSPVDHFLNEKEATNSNSHTVPSLISFDRHHPDRGADLTVHMLGLP